MKKPVSMKITYQKGVDTVDEHFASYGISKYVNGKLKHENIVNVHDDELLRDAIIHLLMTWQSKASMNRPFGDRGVEVAGLGKVTLEEFERLKNAT